MAVFSKKGGTNGGTYAKYFTAQLTVWEKSYSTTNNTSVVGRKLELISGQYGKFSQYYGDWSVSVAGQSTSGGAYYAITTAYTSLVLLEDEITVTHDSDGSKTISCSASINFSSDTYSPRRFQPFWNININKYTKEINYNNSKYKYRRRSNNKN